MAFCIDNRIVGSFLIHLFITQSFFFIIKNKYKRNGLGLALFHLIFDRCCNGGNYCSVGMLNQLHFSRDILEPCVQITTQLNRFKIHASISVRCKSSFLSGFAFRNFLIKLNKFCSKVNTCTWTDSYSIRLKFTNLEIPDRGQPLYNNLIILILFRFFGRICNRKTSFISARFGHLWA